MTPDQNRIDLARSLDLCETCVKEDVCRFMQKCWEDLRELPRGDIHGVHYEIVVAACEHYAKADKTRTEKRKEKDEKLPF